MIPEGIFFLTSGLRSQDSSGNLAAYQEVA